MTADSGTSASPDADPQPTAAETKKPVRRALISVYAKDGLENLARGLHEAGVELVSTGSTAQTIADSGVPVTRVEEITGFPETLDGRVKTLHPTVHAGLLADLRKDSHRAQLDELGIAPFDLVVVNLYPFADTVAAGGAFDEIIEKIDIGGPSMVRGAAKNFANVAVVVDPDLYAEVVDTVRAGGFTPSERQDLAAAAFTHTYEYDGAVSDWLWEQSDVEVDEAAGDEVDILALDEDDVDEEILQPLRYGENPHQRARLLADLDDDALAFGLAGAEQHGGKAMSYNNYVDADAATRAAYDFDEPAVVVMKHNNPCGVAIGAEDAADRIADAHARAHGTDPVSAYGGVIAANRTVTLAMAEQVKPVFTEVIVAPGYDDEALELLQTKTNLRILETEDRPRGGLEERSIWGGTLLQDRDGLGADGDDAAHWRLAAGPAADAATLADLAFAWHAVRAPKSNAILLAADGAAVGIGMGQVNRVDSCRLAIERANTLGASAEGGPVPERARGAVAASDAFFPFADGVQLLLDAGVTAIVQPGGSIRDEEVVAAAEEAGVSMYVTGTRHFAH